ncbi:HARBI1 [Mytilus coruscus]|uniref:HARBI1 n=1 Tax=Mytilus coruscus TaxID=42192 RepID=A0A6J8C851_MYTCO|nr:HARBI1 [Mytilus coruscus]
MYGNRLEKMGAEQEGRVHSTRLKKRLLTYIPDIEAYKQGRENLLALKMTLDQPYEGHIVRKKSVPRSLLTLVNMLLYGPDITTDSFSQETLSIAQMLVFNSHKRIQKSNRHAKSRETPSHMYLGIVIHCQTRKRGLIDKMYKLGLSVSYDRILSVSASLTNTLCKQYQEDGYVCPPSLRIGLFTTAAVDNIDHKPSSTTAKDSFHGTGISLFQHVTSQMNGQQRLDFQLTDIQGGRVTESLPDSYAVVKPAVLKTNVPVIPVTDSACKGCTDDLQEAVQNEYRWRETVANSKENDIEERTLVSWRAYHAEHEPIKDFGTCVSALLPLFEEEAKSVAMIKHSFDVIKTSVDALNPGNASTTILRFWKLFGSDRRHDGWDKATACRAVNDVTNALLSKKDQFIKWPARQEERDRNKQGFFRGGLFPGVIGCIDGTHVKIQAPSEDEPAYVNRKGWHSINVQGVCDHEGKFINVDAQWPGSTHDSHMFRASDVSTYLQIRHRSIDDGFLLGDSGYPCSKFLLTPYLHPATPSQEAYNSTYPYALHYRKGVLVGGSEGFVLHGEVRMKPAKVCRIIGACAILHNIAIMLREPMEDDESGENQEDVGQMNYNGPEDGRTIRNFITTSYF